MHQPGDTDQILGKQLEPIQGSWTRNILPVDSTIIMVVKGAKVIIAPRLLVVNY